jgi:hypothetical protein
MIKKLPGILLVLVAIAVFSWPLASPQPLRALSPTTSVKITRYASDGVSVLEQTTIAWEDMRDTLPVYGDGTTHYYCQGPTFDDSSSDTIWDPGETVNIDTRDYGAAKGTDVKDLCDLIGGASSGDVINIKGTDGLIKSFDYDDVYNPEPAQGRLVITWYTVDTVEGTGGYVPDYNTGMRLLFFTDTVNADGWHVFGNWDMNQTMAESRWHYFYQGGKSWPSSSGLSVKWVSNIDIMSTTPAPPTPTIPSPPQNLRIASLGTSNINIAWDTPANNGGVPVTGYKIYRGTTPGGEMPYNVVLTTNFDDINIVNGVIYYYKVTARNAVGDSGYSNEISAVVPNPTTTPLVPPVIVTPGDSTPPGPVMTELDPSLIWNKATGADSYALVIKRYPYNDNNIVYLDQQIPGDSFYITPRMLNSGEKYLWQVKAHYVSGWSNYSNPLYFQTPVVTTAQTTSPPVTPGITPAAPSPSLNLRISDSVGSLILDWDIPSIQAGSEIEGYKIYRGTSSGDETYHAQTSENVFIDTGVSPGVSYFYRITAFNIIGESGYSNEVVGTVPGTTPSAYPLLVTTVVLTPGTDINQISESGTPTPTTTSTDNTTNKNNFNNILLYALAGVVVLTGLIIFFTNRKKARLK